MTSELRVTTIANNAGSESVDTTYVVNGSAKSFCKFSQSGSHTTNNSFNISSLTDVGTGYTSLTFTSSMANTDYVPTSLSTAGGTKIQFAAFHASGSYRLINRDYEGTGNEDNTGIGSATIGELA